jgi:cytochrome c-type biogenesis protein CcmH
MFVKGSIASNADTAALIEPGAIVFLSVRPINKATGEILGQPLAVERIDIRTLPVEFHLSGANSMVAGTQFDGDVEIYARVDRDGEASSVMPGDVEGRVKATIPAEGLALVLDTVIK